MIPSASIEGRRIHTTPSGGRRGRQWLVVALSIAACALLVAHKAHLDTSQALALCGIATAIVGGCTKIGSA